MDVQHPQWAWLAPRGGVQREMTGRDFEGKGKERNCIEDRKD